MAKTIGKEEVISYAKRMLLDELYSTSIYRKLASMYKRKSIVDKLLHMAQMEARHARFWVEFLNKRGVDVSRIKISKLGVMLRTIFYRLIGLGLTIKLLELEERRAVEYYSLLIESKELSREEKEELRRILEDELVHEEELVSEESMFKDFLEHVRDAVLGMSDGLVEILSAAAGLAGVYNDPFSVAVAGTIVGIAGALSMGIGSYTSVRAQKQVRTGILGSIKLASKYVAHLFKKRVEDYMRRKGFSTDTSKKITEEAVRSNDLLARIIAEEEYGLREEKLEDPRKAGLYTGLFYIMGAVMPLIPYYIGLPIITALPLSFIIASLMLMAVGFIIAISAGLSIRKKMLELVVVGLGSAIITYLIGRLASALLGISID